MNRLTIEQLAPYLTYKLKWMFEGDNVEYDIAGLDTTDKGMHLISCDKYRDYITVSIDSGKPILKPLSDLTKEIEHNGETFVPIDYINGEFEGKIPRKIEVNQSIKNLNMFFTLVEWITFKELYGLFELLFSWHFDVFGLIPAGLAININDLKEETRST